MAYHPRIPVEARYVQSLGQAVYNFAYLEWGVIWSLEKLVPGYIRRSEKQTAGAMASEFVDAARKANLPEGVQAALIAVAGTFQDAVETRNHLLHAHPYTAERGEQRLARTKKATRVDWTIEDIDKAALTFEECAIAVNDLLHRHLETPDPSQTEVRDREDVPKPSSTRMP